MQEGPQEQGSPKYVCVCVWRGVREGWREGGREGVGVICQMMSDDSDHDDQKHSCASIHVMIMLC